ncbi:hypothetical protein FZ103_09560 [Streptomonospora sp. PA3]|uniref:hypothetical protein n=1 Tax=Streptomonospora sp. PA3 TaxID=2607326 RepID=UPI0012DC09C9|nr:hypothetical protein [Streptomonospora sp. PA3]MUL41420.1 hypothetical protein [Streptomonospora sp. PA3]
MTMGSAPDAKSVLRSWAYESLRDEEAVERAASVVDMMLASVAEMTGVETAELDQRVTRLTVTSGTGETRSMKINHGPIPIPHDCHITIELCWPFPDEQGNIYCLQVELPWPCPDDTITIPPIF